MGFCAMSSQRCSIGQITQKLYLQLWKERPTPLFSILTLACWLAADLNNIRSGVADLPHGRTCCMNMQMKHKQTNPTLKWQFIIESTRIYKLRSLRLLQ